MSDWPRVAKSALLQFLAIFLGVSLSFVAEDWRQSLGERREERRVLEGIAADLALDSAEVRWHVDVNRAAAAAGLWLHQNWERDALPGDSITRALGPLHRGGPYSPIRAGYESAKSSGRLQLIANRDLRERIADHYEQRQLLQVRVNEINIAFDFEFWRALRPYALFASDFDGSAIVPHVGLRDDWSNARSDPVLRNTLVHTVVFRRLSALQLGSYAEQSSELRALILEELERR